MKQRIKDAFKQHIHSRVFIKLLFSFLTMLFIPTAFLIVNYCLFQNILREETQQYQHSLLEQVQKSVDERLENIRLTAIDISMDETIERYMDSYDMQGAEFGLYIYEVMNQLVHYRNVYNYLSEIFLYSRHYDCVVSTQTIYYRSIDEIELLDDAAMNQQLFQYFDNERMYCQFVVLEMDTGENSIFCCQTLPLWSTGRATTGTAALQVDGVSLFKDIQNISGLQEGVVALLDGKGQPLIVSGDSELLQTFLEAKEGDRNTLDKEGYFFTEVISGVGNDWKYISIQPPQAYNKQLRDIFFSIIILFSGICLVGVVLAYSLSRQNYSSVEHIINRIEALPPKSNDIINEYKVIEDTLDNMSNAMRHLQEAVNSEMMCVQENMLWQLLTGTVPDYEGYYDKMEQAGILMPNPNSLIILMEIEDYQGCRKKEQELLKEKICHTIAAFFEEEIKSYVIHIGTDRMALLLNGCSEEMETCALKAMQSLVVSVRNELSMILFVSISNVVYCPEDVSVGYYEAQRLLESTRNTDSKEVVCVDKEQKTEWLYFCPDEIRNRLSNLVSMGKSEEALRLLDEAYHICLTGRGVNIYIVRSYFITLVDVVLQTISSQGEKFETFWMQNNPLPAFAMGQKAEQMQCELKQFVKLACELMQQEEYGHTEAMKNAILAYVEENYYNSELSLTMVADYFQITPTYLSTFFKQNMKEMFSVYLTKLRICHAKELLEITNESVSKIALDVGYTNSNSFIRNFKKLEHVTPGEYRDVSRNRK